MDGWLAIYVLFHSISVISGWWADDYESAMFIGTLFTVEKISPWAELELQTATGVWPLLRREEEKKLAEMLCKECICSPEMCTSKIQNLWNVHHQDPKFVKCAPPRSKICEVCTTKIQNLWNVHHQDPKFVKCAPPRSKICEMCTTKIQNLWNVHI